MSLLLLGLCNRVDIERVTRGGREAEEDAAYIRTCRLMPTLSRYEDAILYDIITLYVRPTPRGALTSRHGGTMDAPPPTGDGRPLLNDATVLNISPSTTEALHDVKNRITPHMPRTCEDVTNA